MAYKRPLTERQSLIIAALWIVFATLVLVSQPWTLSLLGILAISGFVVFYPIHKSRNERKGTRRGRGKRK